MNLSVTNNNITNAIVVTTQWPCSTNASTFVTNLVSPIIVSNWWTASVGSYSTNGTGLSASFTPTNGGCGTVTFNLAYINNTPCDTNIYPATPCTLNFSVAELSTNCTAGTVFLGNSSATTNFCFGSGVSLSVTNNNITNAVVVTTQWPCSTNANTSVTNLVSPTIITNWWTLSYGSFNTNGSGLSSASFTPINAGSGTVTFNEYYINNTPCDTNAHSASVAIPFNVLLALNIVDGNGKPISSANSNNVVIVGQNIVLSAVTANSCSENWSNYQWTVDGTTETNFYVQDPGQTNGYPQPLTITTNSGISFFWVDAGTKSVSCSAVCGGVPCSTNVAFTVVRPTISVHGKTGVVVIGHNTYGPCLCFGVPSPASAVGIYFTNCLTMPAGNTYNNGDTNYSTEWIQLITSNPATITISNSAGDVVIYSCQTVGTDLDKHCPYSAATTTDDSPFIGLFWPNEIAASDTQNSMMWLMFKPNNGNWVPLWIVTWECTGAATGFGNTEEDWSKSGDSSISVLTSADSGATYPVWSNNATNFVFNIP